MGSTNDAARYIENFMDLVENFPNDLSRKISLVHELQLNYESSLNSLENQLISFSECPASTSSSKQLKLLLATQRSLMKMQEISDNKLAIMQEALDQLDNKSRELDQDFKLVDTTTTTTTTANSNSKSQSSITSSTARPKASQRDSPKTSRRDSPEPTYCVCHQVSYGDMICCDNDACDIEWFHFQCVALATKPKGKWYCPNCRGDRSNQPKK